MRITVVVPAAGGSRRYSEAGVRRPKHLLKFARLYPGGEALIAPMVAHALRGWPQEQVLIGTTRELVAPTAEAVPSAQVIGLDCTTGQAHSVLQLLAHVPDGPVLVLNCDQGFSTEFVEDFLDKARLTAAHCVAAVVHVPNIAANLALKQSSPYSHVDAYPLFTRAEEKYAISSHALAGAWWFDDARRLARAIECRMRGDRGEPFLSQCLEYLSHNVLGRCALLRQSDWYLWGTPSELAADEGILAVEADVRTQLLPLRTNWSSL